MNTHTWIGFALNLARLFFWSASKLIFYSQSITYNQLKYLKYDVRLIEKYLCILRCDCKNNLLQIVYIPNCIFLRFSFCNIANRLRIINCIVSIYSTYAVLTATNRFQFYLLDGNVYCSVNLFRCIWINKRLILFGSDTLKIQHRRGD
jgi:hypothetical protein